MTDTQQQQSPGLVQPQLPEPSNNVIEDIVRQQLAIVSAYLGTKIQQQHIANHNGAMLCYADKADYANKVGLTEEQKRLGITPFPVPTTIMIDQSGGSKQQSQEKNNDSQLAEELGRLREQLANERVQQMMAPPQEQPAPATSSWTAKWLGPALAGAAITATAALGYKAATNSNQPPATKPAATSTTADNSGEGNVDWEIYGWRKKRDQ